MQASNDKNKPENLLITSECSASPKLYCCVNEKVPSLDITVDLHVDVNNVKPFLCCHEKQERLPFALFPSYKIFCTAVISNT